MPSNTYEPLLRFLCLFVLTLVVSKPIFAQESDIYDLRLLTERDCGTDKLTATLQIRAQADTFRIGTSSILFNYDDQVVSFLSYESLNFDENETVDIFGQASRVWDAHSFNSSFSGIFNLTLLLELPPASRPIIDKEWIDIGKITFSIKNLDASPNFVFDVENTNFNRHLPNDGTGAPTKGDYLVQMSMATGSGTGIGDTFYSLDIIKIDCPQSTIQANLLNDDVGSNATVVLVSPPEKGMATISLDGILNYTTDEVFCGIDELTYQVCNDGSSDCCATGKVYINFINEFPPIFSFTPADETINCEDWTPLSSIPALDDCSGVEVTQTETVEEGDCAGSKIYFRTWTAMDFCGNTAVHTQKLTVQDNRPPDMVCPADITIPCSEITDGMIETENPIASDACSFNDKIEFSYEDDEAIPLDCNFDQRIINRVWSAKDDCGNVAQCTQRILINGNPCLEPDLKETTVYRCENEIVNLRELIPVSDLLEVNFYDKNTEAAIRGFREFQLPITGCTTGVFEFYYEALNAEDCVKAKGYLTIKTVPKFIGELSYIEENCSVTLRTECLETHAITWKDNLGNSGVGNSYEGTPDTSGFVTFYVRPTLELDEELPCAIDSFLADFGCFNPCPETILRNEERTICAETRMDLKTEFDLSDDLNYEYDTDAIVDGIYSIGNPFGCEFGTLTHEIRGYNADNCVLEIINLKLNIVPTLNAEIVQSEEGQCIFNLDFECDAGYTITWEDDLGKTGVGNTYVADENTGGVVTFHVSYGNPIISELESGATCLRQSFSKEFDCRMECPTPTNEAIDLYVCHDEVVNLIEWFNTSEDLKYRVVDSTQQIDLNAVKLEHSSTDCSIIESKLTVEAIDRNNCVVKVFNVTFHILPVITAMVVTSDNCGLKLDVACLDLYTVNWSDSAGEDGEGTVYSASSENGTEVVFTVKIKEEYLGRNLLGRGCFQSEFSGEVNCCDLVGKPCTDGNLATINDVYDENCNCVGDTIPTSNSEISMRLIPAINCEDNTFCTTIQLKADAATLSLGTSSILLNYNPDALEFANYQSIQFDEKETCVADVSSPWLAHRYDGTSVEGTFSLVLTLNSEEESCPEVTTERWESVGTLCFDIMNNAVSPNLVFDSQNTTFNQSKPNDGTATISIGTASDLTIENLLDCNSDDESNMAGGIEVAVKAMLQGPYARNQNLMRDQLRKKAYIPLSEPYTGIPAFLHIGQGGGETISSEVLQVSGENAIVDWVFLEIRADSSVQSVVATKAALIQRDGDIVDIDGVSKPIFMLQEGAYFIVLRHRNHLGVMTANPLDFKEGTTVEVDFTDPNTPTFGTHAQLVVGDKMVLWGGNANPDKYLILSGGGLGLPDKDMIFFDIFLSLWYANPDNPITYNSVLHGYYGSDTNLDGKVKYQGPQNDIDAIIFFNILFHPQNTRYRLNFAVIEQIP